VAIGRFDGGRAFSPACAKSGGLRLGRAFQARPQPFPLTLPQGRLAGTVQTSLDMLQ